LKRKTAEVSSGQFHDKVAPIAEAARKDSAVHVSLSSDSLVKHPGTLRLRLRKAPKSSKLATSDMAIAHGRMIHRVKQ
jgi:hypothetical protein